MGPRGLTLVPGLLLSSSLRPVRLTPVGRGNGGVTRLRSGAHSQTVGGT